MNSLVWKGKVYDYHYKTPYGNNWHQVFYCGDIHMGQIFRESNGRHTSWTAVPNTPSNLAPFYGFRTRFDACEMILKVNGFRLNNYNQPTGPTHDQGTVKKVLEIIDEYSKYANKVGIVNWKTLKNRIIDRLILGKP